MPFFNSTQEALAAGRAVHLAAFAEFDFVEATVYLWDGVGTIDLDGKSWYGAGHLASISGVTFGTDDQADTVTFTLSVADPEIIGLAASEAETIRGRDVFVYGRFMDPLTFEALDDFFLVKHLLMDRLSYAAVGPSARSISLTAETIFTNRNRANQSLYSDRDQQARFSGDLGLEYLPSIRRKKVPWPVF